MTKYHLLTAAAVTFVAAISISTAPRADTISMTRQKACSVEFQALDKTTRGGLAGWQTFYRECAARKAADGHSYARRCDPNCKSPARAAVTVTVPAPAPVASPAPRS